jgi:hypothetical protein
MVAKVTTRYVPNKHYKRISFKESPTIRGISTLLQWQGAFFMQILKG